MATLDELRARFKEPEPTVECRCRTVPLPGGIALVVGDSWPMLHSVEHCEPYKSQVFGVDVGRKGGDQTAIVGMTRTAAGFNVTSSSHLVPPGEAWLGNSSVRITNIDTHAAIESRVCPKCSGPIAIHRSKLVLERVIEITWACADSSCNIQGGFRVTPEQIESSRDAASLLDELFATSARRAIEANRGTSGDAR